MSNRRRSVNDAMAVYNRTSGRQGTDKGRTIVTDKEIAPDRVKSGSTAIFNYGRF